LAGGICIFLLSFSAAFGQGCPPLYQKNGGFSGALFGHSVAGAGDVDSNGTPDFIVGAPAPNDAGVNVVYVYSGLTGAMLYSKSGPSANVQFGVAVAGAGDVNKDG